MPDIPMKRDLALVAQLQEGVDCTVRFERLLRRTDVELHEIEMIGVHPLQALLDAGADVLAGELVRRDHLCGSRGGGFTRHPHFDARKYSSRRDEMCSPMSSSDGP